MSLVITYLVQKESGSRGMKYAPVPVYRACTRINVNRKIGRNARELTMLQLRVRSVS